MRELLSSVVDDGSGRAAQLPIPAFGKTGTSQGFRDAWFIGFAGDLVVGVWVGNDDNTPMKGVTGGSLPAQIWQSFMQDVLDADADFQRKPPPVAVFEARSRAPLKRPSSLASLKGLVAAADQHSRTTRRFREAMARGSETLLSSKAEQGAPVNEDFQHKVSDTGWLDR
jgi:penicillin-binding protein 1A